MFTLTEDRDAGTITATAVLENGNIYSWHAGEKTSRLDLRVVLADGVSTDTYEYPYPLGVRLYYLVSPTGERELTNNTSLAQLIRELGRVAHGDYTNYDPQTYAADDEIRYSHLKSQFDWSK